MGTSFPSSPRTWGGRHPVFSLRALNLGQDTMSHSTTQKAPGLATSPQLIERLANARARARCIGEASCIRNSRQARSPLRGSHASLWARLPQVCRQRRCQVRRGHATRVSCRTSWRVYRWTWTATASTSAPQFAPTTARRTSAAGTHSARAREHRAAGLEPGRDRAFTRPPSGQG